jgi:L-threonylcarbamoyladenylate synthase
MKTKIIKINPRKLNISKIKMAAEFLRKGGLIAFPTETVYGLGANAFDKNAVNKIFIVKGRPNDNPLIAHICNEQQLLSLVKRVPNNARSLMDCFWPGPLTIILKKKKSVPDEVTAGLSSVAVRMPKNKIALELIKTANVPIVAPSANISGKPSPTNVKHVIDDLDDKIDCIIDGGNVDIGLESTVIDLTQKPPVILRPGKITKLQIEKVIGKIKENKKETLKPKCPGMKYKHYSPDAKIIIIKDEKEIMAIHKQYPNKKIKQLKYLNKIQMAKKLFEDFRSADKIGYDIIIVKEIEDKEFGRAIMDRLRKASGIK